MAILDYSDVISTSVLPDALRVVYSAELEFTSRPNLIFDQLCESKNDFQAKRGERVTWTIIRQLPPAIGPLTENQDISASELSDFQVSFTVNEYGYAIGTSEKLDLLSYFGPISDVVKSVLAPQMGLTTDIIARNTFYNPANSIYHNYGGGANRASRETITSTDVCTGDTLRAGAFNLSVRRIPQRGTAYIGIAHPAIVFDLQKDTSWINAQLYAGSTNIFSGEEGMLHGVRILKSDNARLPNGGLNAVQSTLSSATSVGQLTVPVVSATGFTVGSEVSIYSTGYVDGASTVLPNGTDPLEEAAVIQSIAGNTLTLRTALTQPHNAGVFVTQGLTIYPIVFTGAIPAVGKGNVVAPEVRVALPTDKLRRLSYIGWYGLFGYGMLRNWAVDVWECASSALSSAPAFPW
jgi:N4-gp56 family major capsid protein